MRFSEVWMKLLTTMSDNLRLIPGTHTVVEGGNQLFQVGSDSNLYAGTVAYK